MSIQTQAEWANNLAKNVLYLARQGTGEKHIPKMADYILSCIRGNMLVVLDIFSHELRTMNKMDELTEAQQAIVQKLLLSDFVKNEMGAANWELTEEEEIELWKIRDLLTSGPRDNSNDPAFLKPRA